MTKSISRKRAAKAAQLATPKKRWQLQTAKAQFSELFRRAHAEGPQWVTRQDKEAVVVLTAEEFERLQARSRQPRSLVQFFAESPLAGVRINLKRKPDYGRTVKL
jgi:prevent-host-death family protein